MGSRQPCSQHHAYRLAEAGLLLTTRVPIGEQQRIRSIPAKPSKAVLRRPSERKNSPQTHKFALGALTTGERRFAENFWLPFVDAFRTICIAPSSEARSVFEAIKQLTAVSGNAFVPLRATL